MVNVGWKDLALGAVFAPGEAVNLAYKYSKEKKKKKGGRKRSRGGRKTRRGGRKSRRGGSRSRRR